MGKISIYEELVGVLMIMSGGMMMGLAFWIADGIGWFLCWFLSVFIFLGTRELFVRNMEKQIGRENVRKED